MTVKKFIPSFLSILIFQFSSYYMTKIINEPLPKFDFTTDLDRALPFMPSFIYVYILSYLFWIGAIVLIAFKTKKENYYNTLAALYISYTVCALFFIFLPTTIVRPQFEPATLSQRLTAFIYSSDTPINLFPSMHCLLSWVCFAATRGVRTLARTLKFFIFIFALLVCISTQAVKQHYIADLISGIGFAEIIWLLSSKLRLGRFAEKIFER